MTHNREVTVVQVGNDTYFDKLNLAVYGGSASLMGPSGHAEKVLSSKGGLLKALLPTVLGLDNQAPTWQTEVSKYLYNFGLDVPANGKKLNVGFRINLTDAKLKANLTVLLKGTNVAMKDEKEILAYLIGYSNPTSKIRNVEEIDLYNYVEFLSPLDYYLYIYCLYSNQVANVKSLVKKSSNINYYLVSQVDKEAEKRRRYNLDKYIRQILDKVDRDSVFADSMYSVLNITHEDDIDKAIAFSEMCKTAPTTVVNASKDKNLKDRATIENYIRLGLMNRLMGSSMVTDSKDASVIIGSNITECITFLNNQDNNAIIAQYNAQYEALTKK